MLARESASRPESAHDVVDASSDHIDGGYLAQANLPGKAHPLVNSSRGPLGAIAMAAKSQPYAVGGLTKVPSGTPARVMLGRD